MATGEVINVDSWVEENKKFFLPPVCNKLMHNCQLKVMFVGGPNIRKDYHIEEGEELFYMVKGDMCVKIIERGVHKDVNIKEGEIFLLPARIPHSPQRPENTVGLVIERDRFEKETDALRYFVGDSTDTLFERCFHSVDLGVELPPLIKEYFASDEFKTGKPKPETFVTPFPFELDSTTVVDEPISLQQLIKEKQEGNLFPNIKQFKVSLLSDGKNEVSSNGAVEDWIWLLSGESSITIGGVTKKLKTSDSILIPANTGYVINVAAGAKVLKIQQDGNKK